MTFNYALICESDDLQDSLCFHVNVNCVLQKLEIPI
jgi:hypothetical protein